ncbi:PREDICTED: olfactory receptor 9I1-like [Ceratotherium simum simum]|uniref:Olfactory receptor 9I1-like n=1 Tax=Ceratotherium simum simum TaxID=73337 RepID=A0ABM1D9V8_CERSS|nr:PREDICTED: olfactory receptor 9I1-like [Ceratotherium simum simum]
MAKNNLTTVNEFILMGFTDYTKLEIPLFLMFLSFYLVTLLGNVGMIILIQVDVQLQTPMYFFLRHLSLLDACYTSVIIPQILATLAKGKMVISYSQCAAQFLFFTVCAATECFLLAVMAYDRYVAISKPLLYPVAMNPRVCWSLVVGAYVCGMSGAILRTSCTFTLSSGGRAKTFSTCASHLTAVALFFGTLIFMYLRSSSGKSPEEDKVVSVFYTVVIPMLNPLIYSLRNKDVKAAFKKITGRCQGSQSK